jgi:hypothetical protein
MFDSGGGHVAAVDNSVKVCDSKFIYLCNSIFIFIFVCISNG